MLSIGVNLLDVVYSYDVSGRYVQAEQMRCNEYAVLTGCRGNMQELYIGNEKEKTSLELDEIVSRTISSEGSHEASH